jgi:NAD(P)-dependent dehydrogenase (short-subunit alcohol dehydrogenase family)
LKKCWTSYSVGYLAEPREIASVVAYLCSREAAYTGQTVSVDGGAIMR